MVRRLRIDVPIITAAAAPEARNDEVGLPSDIRIVRFRCPPCQLGVRERAIGRDISWAGGWAQRRTRQSGVAAH